MAGRVAVFLVMFFSLYGIHLAANSSLNHCATLCNYCYLFMSPIVMLYYIIDIAHA
jgi:hypothetical protein